MDYRAVLFDFDYTLGDTTEPIVRGFRYAFERMGLPAPEREAVRGTIGHMLEDAFTLLTGETSPERRAEFRRWFTEKAHPLQVSETHLFPGAKELLSALRAAGIKVGVVSTKGSAVLREILARQGELAGMDVVLGGDQVARPKPDPEGLNRAVAGLGLEKRRVLFCGDTVIDAETAQRAGTDFCAVLNGTTPAEAFEEFPHVHIAPGLAELKGWLGR